MTNNYCKKKKKKKLSKRVRQRYQSFSEEEKDKKQQYACERDRNLSEEGTEKKHQYCRKRYKNLQYDEHRKRFSRMQETKTSRVQNIFIFGSWSIKNLFRVGFFGKNIRIFFKVGFLFKLGLESNLGYCIFYY